MTKAASLLIAAFVFVVFSTIGFRLKLSEFCTTIFPIQSEAMTKIIAQIIGYIGAIKGVQSISASKFEKDLVAAIDASGDAKSAEVHIHSRGGSIDEGNAMISAMKKCGAEIMTVNNGLCASMAVAVFAAGDERLAAKNSIFMIHGGSCESVDNTASGHRLAADMIEAYNHTIAVTLAEVLKNEDGSAMSVDDVKAKYLNDGQDHYLTADEAVACGLATGIADFSAENMPTNLMAMSATEVEAHFGYNTPVAEETTDIEGWDLYLCGNLSNAFIQILGLCDDVECSENPSLANFAKKISVQAAANFSELATLLNISEQDDMQAVATKLRQRISATLKPQSNVVAVTEFNSVKAELATSQQKITELSAKADEVTASLTAKANELATAQTEIASLKALIPGAAINTGNASEKKDQVEASATNSGWKSFLTSTDKERIAKGELKLN